MRLAPFGDPTWQIWGCSPGVYGVATRVDAWFELHRYEPGQPWFSPEYCQWLSKRECPVFMAEPRPEIPRSEVLPVDALVAKYGPYFFTSSLAWMFATALEAGATKIALYGVDMAACCSHETKVLTADLRWVRSDTLNVGDKLIAFDEEPVPNGESVPQRRWRVAEVLRADRITKPCYRVTLEDGREIICSDEHKWLTHAENECRWKMTKDLVTPQHRAGRHTKIVQVSEVWEEDKTWEAGYLAAAIDGEGHLSQRLKDGDHGALRVGFAQRENAMSRMVEQICEAKGFQLSLDASEPSPNGPCNKYTLKGGRAKNMEFLGKIRPRRLLDKFDPSLLGMMQKIGKVAVVKTEFIGEHPVIGLTTSTGTFVAEGLATHNTDEYGDQRSGLHYFGMLAAAMGVEVGVPPESDLFRPRPLYGVDEIRHSSIKLLSRQRELDARLRDAQQREEMAKQERCFLQGALDDVKYQALTWADKADHCGPPVVEAMKALLPDEHA